MGNLLAYVLNFDISVCIAIGVGRSIRGGAGEYLFGAGSGSRVKGAGN
jgi:hypothetical protein